MSRGFRLLVFGAGAVVFVLLVARAGPAEIVARMRAAPWLVASLVLVFGVVYLMNTVTWRLTMERELRLPFWRAYALGVSAFAINYVTPFVNLGGEPYRAAAAAGALGTKEAALSVLRFRLLHTLAHFLWLLTGLLMGIALVLRRDRGATALVGLLVLGVVVLLTLTVALLAVHRTGGITHLVRIAEHLPLPARARRRLAAAHPMAAEIDGALATLYQRSPARFFGAIAAEYVGRLISTTELVIIGRSVGAPVGYVTAMVMATFTSAVLNLFFFVPFELGSREGSLALIVHLLGLPRGLGVYAALIGRLREMTWVGIGLVLVLVTGGVEDVKGVKSVKNVKSVG